MAAKKLYRSNSERMIGGICGGIAEYFSMDPTIVRIIWILLVFFGGSGILLYILGLIIIPLNPDNTKFTPNSGSYVNRNTFTFFIGAFFLITGMLILFHNLGFIPFRFWHHGWDIIFAIGLIMFGIYLFLRHPISKEQESPAEVSSEGEGAQYTNNNRHVLHKSRTDKKLFGVCAGLAEYLNIDPTFVRIGWVFFVFVSAGLALILYIVLALVLPEKKFANS
jgi:phage shock protein PspC (stress-responsive transcriptional regulator)